MNSASQNRTKARLSDQSAGVYGDGFTLVESLIGIALISLLLASAMGALIYFMHAERNEAVRNELDGDARALVERLQRDLWRSARGEILLHPEGEGPYEAISFPVVAGNEPLQLNEAGRIEWDATVIYHLRDGIPSEVRRTVFRPRAELSDAERRQQMAYVVRQGEGSGTFNGINAFTRTLITNPVEWELTVHGSRFDAYSPESGRRKVALGTAFLQSGENNLTFEVVDKNPAHTGNTYHLGLDAVVVSPSGLALEAEWQPVVIEESSHAPMVENMGVGEVWSGNSRLWFSSTRSIGDKFTLRVENDRWEERNFTRTGARRDNLDRKFIQPSDRPHTFVLELQGNDIIWEATEQARTDTATFYEPPGSNVAVRVFVRGEDIVEGDWTDDFDGGWINATGTNVWATFRGDMRIEQAFIAEADSPESKSEAMNYRAGTRIDFTFGGDFDQLVEGSSTTDPAPFLIDTQKSYIVGLLVSPHPDSEFKPLRWEPDEAENPSSFIIHDADLDTFNEADWSGLSDLEEHAAVVGLESLRVGYAPEGTFISSVIDTHLPNPDYETFAWSATQPENSELTMKVRAGDQPDLADALGWHDIPAAQAGLRPPISGRYAQVKAILVPGDDALHTPQLEDFTLRWAGEQRYMDLSAIISTGPNHGVYQVSLNNAPLVQGVTVRVSVFKEAALPGGKERRLESSAFAEIVPRN